MPLLARFILLLSLPLFLLDFITKEWTVRAFREPSVYGIDHQEVIPGFFDLVRLHNRGVAWGMGHDLRYSNWIFGGISTAAMVAIFVFWQKNAFPTRVAKTAAALIISGIAGNLLDRLTRGYVVDFLSFHFRGWHWPAFNVADACIFIAAGLFIISSFQKLPDPQKTP